MSEICCTYRLKSHLKTAKDDKCNFSVVWDVMFTVMLCCITMKVCVRVCVGGEKRDTDCSLVLFPLLPKNPTRSLNYHIAVQIQVDAGSSVAPSVLLYSRKSCSLQTVLGLKYTSWACRPAAPT